MSRDGAPKPEHREQAAQLYRDQFPRNNYATAYSTIDAIAHAIANAEQRGRVAERLIVRDWINNNLGERNMTDLLMDIVRRSQP